MGQKNGRARIWAKRGTRPRLPADQRYTNAYLFGAICPRSGKGAALMLPFANTRAMQMHLDEISCNVAAKAHGVVLMDRAGWHSTGKLKVPKNLTIILLPSRSPELNPVRIGSRTASSKITTPSSRPVAKPGTSSSINQRRSCPSD